MLPLLRFVGRSSPCSMNQRSVWRALPSSATLSKTSVIASCTRRSGSFSSVAHLHEADRRGHDEFTTSSLLVARRERTLAQQVEFVLVETALQAEQEAIIALSRGINCLLVNQHRVDDAAHLDELLPVVTVTGEAET